MTTWPTNDITTTHLDSPNDSIGLARAEILHAMEVLSQLIDSGSQPNGVPLLDASGQIPTIHMPTTLQSGGANDINLLPATEVVALSSVLALNPKTVAELEVLSAAQGAIAYCSNGNAGAACYAVSTGTHNGSVYVWNLVPITLTQISAT